MPLPFHLPVAVLAGLLPFAAAAAPAAPATPWLELHWNLRLRHEHVDDDAFARAADATTLRLRAGVHARLGSGFGALVEGEGIAAAGAHDSGANGRSGLAAIGDPGGSELNQAWIGWKGERVQARLGRQRLDFGNQRWIGAVGWRQNEQTFDALALEGTPRPGMNLRFAWLDRVHRVAGDRARAPLARERDLSTRAMELGWTRGALRWTGYAFLHDDRDVPSASTATWGLRAVADHVRDGRGWGLALELARQRDHAGNPLDFAHGYWLVEPAYTLRGTRLRAGWEHLGGDGRHALQTPLATLHAFNGWADRFAITPAGGLDDRYLGAAGRAGKGDWNLAWHDYRADTGPRHGSEWNAAFGWPLRADLKLLAKAAHYRAGHHGRDAGKFWLQLEWTR